MKLLILSGLPGSGKSTWAKQFVFENKDWVRVNRDDLRNMRGTYWIPKQEDMITEMEDQCVLSAFRNGFNVVLDSTNLNVERNKNRYFKYKQSFPSLSVEYKFIDTPLEECIKRDLARPNSIGEKVITEMYEKYIAPPPVTYTEDKSLPRCVIFDVDGTLAKMNGRGPFEWDRVGEDSLNYPVAQLTRMIPADVKVVIFTGRDGVCLPQTMKWLDDNEITYDELFIRPKGNTEKDSVIKRRLFEEHIRGKYYCEFVVDDRDQVVAMWRKEIGLTCFQVDYGDF